LLTRAKSPQRPIAIKISLHVEKAGFEEKKEVRKGMVRAERNSFEQMRGMWGRLLGTKKNWREETFP